MAREIRRSLPIMLQASPDLPVPYSPLGGFLFSYAVAAAIVAIGLLVGWMYQVSVSRQPIANQARPSPASPLVVKNPKLQLVARITGTFQCQPADGSTAITQGGQVRLGNRFALASGLVEISYTSGAKVLLQGPCIV